MRYIRFMFVWQGPTWMGEIAFHPFYWRKWDAHAGNGLWTLNFGPFHFDHQLFNPTDF